MLKNKVLHKITNVFQKHKPVVYGNTMFLKWWLRDIDQIALISVGTCQAHWVILIAVSQSNTDTLD